MYNFSKLEQESNKIIEWYSGEIAKLRTGRASPQIVEDVKVDYYGQISALKTIASISVQDAKTLLIKPWDKNAIPSIEKAVIQSNIGINPVADKDHIRLILPELTGERREILVKNIKEKLEEARVSLRKIRSDVWEDIQEREKAKEISEDDKFRLKNDLQKKIDDFQKRLEDSADRKIEEIRA